MKYIISGSGIANNSAGFCFGTVGRSATMLCIALAASWIALPAAWAAQPKYAPWIEPDFPFTSTSLDLREVDPESVPMNVTPRGLLLNLGHEQWVCFDTELLRISAAWRGTGVTPEALGPLTYQEAGNFKTRGGQDLLPKPKGKISLWNGVYPGWQPGGEVSYTDPRKPQPSIEEPGRGPLPTTVGRFRAIRHEADGVVLLYTVAGAQVEDRFREAGGSVIRSIHLGPCEQPVNLVLARDWTIRFPAHAAAMDVAYDLTKHSEVAAAPPVASAAPQRWANQVITKATLSSAKDPYVVDQIQLPYQNPWRRNVRLCDVAFFRNGTAAASTFDGDIWMIEGLGETLGDVTWHRFASGLHEPMSIAVRGDELYVFDRNGIWCLRDTDHNGEADVHELFSNVFAQSAETREFPNSLKVAPDGSFVIAKGGQQDSTISELNGSVVRVAADGQSYTVLGHGFRQPFAGCNPVTGEVTAADQEGHYTPTTPLYLLTKDEFHGFLSTKLPKEQYPAPIAEPLTWIPHQVNASAVAQLWLTEGANMGPLNGSLLHTGFNRPELFRVLLNHRGTRPQAAVISLLRDFDVPALNAALNPADGCVYLTGFQVVGWGTTSKSLAALARVRYTGAPLLTPSEVAPMDHGVLMTFEVSLDPKSAGDRASYTMESWHYRRTSSYGSPHLKADGTPGQDWLTPSSAYLSQDGHKVFVALPGITPVQQMRIGWSLRTTGGTAVEGNAYFTPYELTKFDPVAEGFGRIEVDLTPKPSLAPATQPASVEEGKRLYQLMGCMACHTTSDSDQAKIGPSWKGLYGKKRDIYKGDSVEATEDYLRESMVNPTAKIVKGFEKIEAGMPVYAGVLNDMQIDSLILYIKTL